MRQVACNLIAKLAVKVLRVKRGSPFSEVPEIVIQDGSSFALKDCLGRVFPGRFTTVRPAAVEVHASMNLLKGSVQEVTVTADTGGKHARSASIRLVPEVRQRVKLFLAGADRDSPRRGEGLVLRCAAPLSSSSKHDSDCECEPKE